MIFLLKEIPLATGNFSAWTRRDELFKCHVKFRAVIKWTEKRPKASSFVMTNVEVWLISARECFVDRSVKVMVPSGVSLPPSSTQETLTGSRNLILALILPVCATCGKTSVTVPKRRAGRRYTFPRKESVKLRVQSCMSKYPAQPK